VALTEPRSGALWHRRARCWVAFSVAGPAAQVGKLLVLAAERRSILIWNPRACQVGEEESAAGREWHACPSVSISDIDIDGVSCYTLPRIFRDDELRADKKKVIYSFPPSTALLTHASQFESFKLGGAPPALSSRTSRTLSHLCSHSHNISVSVAVSLKVKSQTLKCSIYGPCRHAPCEKIPRVKNCYGGSSSHQ
jgi:hypothetical protein